MLLGVREAAAGVRAGVQGREEGGVEGDSMTAIVHQEIEGHGHHDVETAVKAQRIVVPSPGTTIRGGIKINNGQRYLGFNKKVSNTWRIVKQTWSIYFLRIVVMAALPVSLNVP